MKKIKVRGGLKIPLHGSVKNKEFDHIHPKFVGILADDYFSLKPKFLVKEGDSVTTGDPIFEDKTNPGFYVKSPISGTVSSVNRGEKRALVSVILENDKDASEELVTFRRTGNVSKDLNSAGLWDSFRERPFNRVPKIDSTPDHVFINACRSDILELEPTDLIINNLDDFN
jgi:Na+-transporting NADH:ubiquinone oxidoreductase, subunit NqrA